MAKYADYLAKKEEEERQTPAAPSNESGGYAAWLQAEVQRQNAENTPVKNASSFAEYLGGTAGDIVGQYGATVDQAAIDAAKQRTTYGAQAETLARNGLGQSGYGQYLEGEVYRQQQQTVRNAQQIAAQQVADAKKGYAAYLSGVKQQNAQIEQQNLQNEEAAYSALANAVANGMTLDAARASLEGGMYGQYLDRAVERYNNAQTAQIQNTIKNLQAVTSASNLDRNSNSYDQDLQLLQENNARLFKDAVGDNFTGIQQYIDSLAEKKNDGTVKKTGQEVWNKMSGEAKALQIREWLIEARNNGDITSEQLSAIYGADYEEQMAKATGNGDVESAQNIRENAKTEYEEGVISEEQYNKIKEDFQEMIRQNGNISVQRVTKSDKGNNFDIGYYDIDKGKESVLVETTGKFKVKPEFKSAATIDGIEIGFVDDDIVIKEGSTYYKTKIFEGGDNKDFVNWLADKVGKQRPYTTENKRGGR